MFHAKRVFHEDSPIIIGKISRGRGEPYLFTKWLCLDGRRVERVRGIRMARKEMGSECAFF